MYALKRILSAPNWKYAVGEVILIFAGITLALLANSWQQNLNDREEEIGLLRQLLLGVEADISLIDDRQSRIEDKVNRMKGLQHHIRESLPYSDDLRESFRTIASTPAASINTAPFEMLKYRGIHLVSDPGLRNQLVDYYDTEQKLLIRRNEYDLFNARDALPYFKKNFRWDSESLLMEPVDYKNLIKEQEFLNILAVRIWSSEKLTLRVYRRLRSKSQNLAKAVEQHLDSLQ